MRGNVRPTLGKTVGGLEMDRAREGGRRASHPVDRPDTPATAMGGASGRHAGLTRRRRRGGVQSPVFGDEPRRLVSRAPKPSGHDAPVATWTKGAKP
jgi:hypothetical protein